MEVLLVSERQYLFKKTLKMRSLSPNMSLHTNDPLPFAASSVSVASLDGAVVASANVLDATASCSRDAAATFLAANTTLAVVAAPLDATMSASASSANRVVGVVYLARGLFINPPCESWFCGRSGHVEGVLHGFGRSVLNVLPLSHHDRDGSVVIHLAKVQFTWHKGKYLDVRKQK